MFDIEKAKALCTPEATFQDGILDDCQETLGSAIAEIERLKQALTSVIRHEPNYPPFPEDEMNAPCPDCAEAERRNWPPSRKCDKHYTVVARWQDACENARKYQHLDMRNIARDALSA